MGNISIIGLIISVVIIILFLIEIILFFSSFNKRKKSYIPLHLLGVITTFLVGLFTITSSIGVNIESDFFVKILAVFAVVFFIAAAIDTLRVDQVNKFSRK